MFIIFPLIENLLMLATLIWHKKNKTIPNVPKLKVNDGVRITNMRIILVKVTMKTGQGKYMLLIIFWKLIPGPIKLKRLYQWENNGKFLWKRIPTE